MLDQERDGHLRQRDMRHLLLLIRLRQLRQLAQHGV
jgi:hypothetical protein